MKEDDPQWHGTDESTLSTLARLRPPPIRCRQCKKLFEPMHSQQEFHKACFLTFLLLRRKQSEQR